MGSRTRRGLALLIAAGLVGLLPMTPAGAEQVNRDTGFGVDGDGLVVFDFDADYDSAADVAVQPDSRIVVVGSARIAGDDDVVVARLLPNGSPDASFGDNGFVAFHAGTESATAVALQPDGRIVVAGSSNGNQLVLRLEADGDPDPTFGSGGVALPAGGFANDVALTADGHILLAGEMNTGWVRQGDLSVTSLRADGSIEPAFGTDGVTQIDTGSVSNATRYERADALAVGPDGAITAVGMVSTANNPNTDLLLVRLHPNGTLMGPFGGTGIVTRDIGGGHDALHDVLAESDGRVTVTGRTSAGGGTGRLLAGRLLPSGTWDGGFGAAGVTTYTPNVNGHAVGYGLARDAAGRTLIAGLAWGLVDGASLTDGLVVRLTPGGHIDTSFGGGAHGIDAYGDNDAAEAVAVAPDGAIIAVGRGYYDTSEYTESGSYDADWTIARLVLAADPPPPPPPPPPPAPPERSGYWMVGRGGEVYGFGDSAWMGNAPVGNRAAVDLEPTPSGRGYWVVDDLGHVFTAGDAGYAGGAPALRPFESVTSISSSATGRGYWLFTTMGRVFAYGDAPFLGDMAATRLNGPVLDSIPTPSGQGYYLVASDGGIFTFGDAAFLGSMGDHRLNAPVQSLVPDGDGRGYWLVASDGGIFAFDAAFRGSMGDTRLNGPITGMVRFGGGYLMVGTDGGIFNFSDREFLGSLGANPPPRPVVSVAALPS